MKEGKVLERDVRTWRGVMCRERKREREREKQSVRLGMPARYHSLRGTLTHTPLQTVTLGENYSNLQGCTVFISTSVSCNPLDLPMVFEASLAHLFKYFCPWMA